MKALVVLTACQTRSVVVARWQRNRRMFSSSSLRQVENRITFKLLIDWTASRPEPPSVLPNFMIIAMYLYLLYLFVGEGIVDIPLAFTDPSDRLAGTDLMPRTPR